MADDLLRCAQYLADAEAFRANTAIKVICGIHYAELETPFAEIIEIAHWATETRQELASVGEAGILVRDFLFNASANQLDQFRALHARELFDSLREVLGKNLGEDDLLWDDLIRRQQARVESIGKVADVFERARFHNGCHKREIESAYRRRPFSKSSRLGTLLKRTNSRRRNRNLSWKLRLDGFILLAV